MKSILRVVAYLFVLLSFNAKALIVNGYEITWYADLSGANFSNMDLSGVNFLNSNLSNTVFSGADLSGSDLSLTLGWSSADFTDALYNRDTVLPNLSGMLVGSELIPLWDYTFNGVIPQICTEANYYGSCISFRDVAAGETLSILTDEGRFLIGSWYQLTFNPDDYGMIFVSEVPLPAGITLFLSGLVGLGLMRGRNG